MGKMKELFMKLREQELVNQEMRNLANEDRILKIQEQEKISKGIREKQNKKDNI